MRLAFSKTPMTEGTLYQSYRPSLRRALALHTKRKHHRRMNGCHMIILAFFFLQQKAVQAVQVKVMEAINKPFMQLTAAFRKRRLLKLTSITKPSMVLDSFNSK